MLSESLHKFPGKNMTLSLVPHTLAESLSGFVHRALCLRGRIKMSIRDVGQILDNTELPIWESDAALRC